MYLYARVGTGRNFQILSVASAYGYTGIFVRLDLPFSGCMGVDGKVGASDNANLDFGVHSEREADCVLLSSQEAFRAIDLVDSPHSYEVYEVYFPSKCSPNYH